MNNLLKYFFDKILSGKIRFLCCFVMMCVAVGMQQSYAKGDILIIYSNDERESLELADRFAKVCVERAPQKTVYFYREATDPSRSTVDVVKDYQYLKTMPYMVVPPKSPREFQCIEKEGVMDNTITELYDAPLILLAVEEGKPGEDRIHDADKLLSKVMLDVHPSFTSLRTEKDFEVHKKRLTDILKRSVNDEGYLISLEEVHQMRDKQIKKGEDIGNDIKSMEEIMKDHRLSFQDQRDIAAEQLSALKLKQKRQEKLLRRYNRQITFRTEQKERQDRMRRQLRGQRLMEDQEQSATRLYEAGSQGMSSWSREGASRETMLSQPRRQQMMPQLRREGPYETGSQGMFSRSREDMSRESISKQSPQQWRQSQQQRRQQPMSPQPRMSMPRSGEGHYSSKQ